MRKYSLRTWLALGTASTFVLGTGFFAVTTDQANINGNRVETSGDQPTEDALDIQIAQAAPGDPWPTCLGPDVQWQDASIPAAFDSTIGVGPGERVYEGAAICVRRLDSIDASANIVAHVGNFLENDPVCSTGEVGDNDCGTTDPGTGEISSYVTWETVLDINSDLCTPFGQRGTGNAPLNEAASDQVILMTPGNSSPICVGFQLVTNMQEDSPGLAELLSDVATWDWILTAEL